MDATPARMKARALGQEPRHVRVVRPRSFDELVATVHDLGLADQRYTILGGRSNVVGALATDAEVALSTELLTDVVAFDPVSNLVTVGAGTIGGKLEEWLTERDRTLGQLPQSLHLSTIGGWVATRATGSLSTLYGGVEHAVRGARVVSPSGEVLTFGPRVRPPGGVDGLAPFFGSEGSLGVVAEVTLEVHRRLPERSLCFSFPDLDAVIEAQRELVQDGHVVAMLRGYNAAETAHLVGEHAGAGCLLMVTTIGPSGLVDAQQDAIVSALRALGGVELGDDPARRWHAERYDVETMMEDRNRHPGTAFDTIEVSVPWATASACAHEMEEVLSTRTDQFYLHFSHAYESGVCFYSLVWLTDDTGDAAVLDRLSEVWDQALSIAERHGGAIGHHHGVGGARATRYQNADDARIHRALKQSWDPGHLLRARLLSSTDL